MRLFRCGCGLLSILPVLLLLAGGLFLLNNPHTLPGPLGDLAAAGRSSLATVALGVELNSSDLSVSSIDYNEARGGTLTLTLITTKTAAPSAEELASTFKSVGGHLTGPLSLADGPVGQVVLVIQRAGDEKTLVTFTVSAADLRAYIEGDLTAAAFAKRVTVTP